MDYDYVIRKLKNEGIEFHSFVFNTNKRIKVVVHKLPKDAPCEEISAELQEKGFEVQYIRQLTKYANGQVCKLTKSLVDITRNETGKKYL